MGACRSGEFRGCSSSGICHSISRLAGFSKKLCAEYYGGKKERRGRAGRQTNEVDVRARK